MGVGARRGSPGHIGVAVNTRRHPVGVEYDAVVEKLPVVEDPVGPGAIRGGGCVPAAVIVAAVLAIPVTQITRGRSEGRVDRLQSGGQRVHDGDEAALYWGGDLEGHLHQGAGGHGVSVSGAFQDDHRALHGEAFVPGLRVLQAVRKVRLPVDPALGLDAELGGLPGIADLDQVDGGQHGPDQQQAGRQGEARRSRAGSQEQVKKNTRRQLQTREKGASEIRSTEVAKLASLLPGLENGKNGARNPLANEHVKKEKVVRVVPETMLKPGPANMVKLLLEMALKQKENSNNHKQAPAEQDLVVHQKEGHKKNVKGSKGDSFRKVIKLKQCSQLHKSKHIETTKTNIKSISWVSRSSKHLQLMQTKKVQEKERKGKNETQKHPVQEIVEELLDSVTNAAKNKEYFAPKHHRIPTSYLHSVPPMKLSHLKKIKLEKSKSRTHQSDGQPSVQMYTREGMIPETPRGTRKKIAMFRGLKRQIQMPSRYRDEEPTNPKTKGTTRKRDMRCRVRLALEGKETIKDIPSSFQQLKEKQQNMCYLNGVLGSCNVIKDPKSMTKDVYKPHAEEMEMSQQILEVAVQAPKLEAFKVFCMP